MLELLDEKRERSLSSMVQYTVYQIEKMTNGKLSKYRLNKAIESGDLKCQIVEADKHGRGIPKYYVNRDDLIIYLELIEKQYKQRIELSEVSMNGGASSMDDIEKIVRNYQKEIMGRYQLQFESLEQKIGVLEKLQEQYSENVYATLEQKKKGIVESGERRNLLMELMQLNPFQIRKKRDLLKYLLLFMTYIYSHRV